VDGDGAITYCDRTSGYMFASWFSWDDWAARLTPCETGPAPPCIRLPKHKDYPPMTLVRRVQIVSKDDPWIRTGVDKKLFPIGDGRYLRLPQEVIDNLNSGKYKLRIGE
jgi:hypothetical protein